MARRWSLTVALVLAAVIGRAGTGPEFSRYFLPKTLRVDLYHTGMRGQEVFALDQLVEQPLWAGSRTNLVDTLNLGKYLVKLFDLSTNQLIYSRGFCSIFGEWETTDEARSGIARTFHESVLVPFPRRPVQLVIAKRVEDPRAQNAFRDLFWLELDLSRTSVRAEPARYPFAVRRILGDGNPERKVDVLILGDGYTASEMSKFRKDVGRFVGELFRMSPFKEHRSDFNVWTIEVVSEDSGIDEPDRGVWRRNALGCSYNTFGTPRYVLTLENKVVRDIAAMAPYDQLYLIVNSERYGGGGIFNLYSVCYSGTERPAEKWWADYVFVHEFGHAFAGLGDEYYSSSVSYVDFYPRGVEPWEPNLTALLQPSSLKWKDLVDPNVPLPTPWEKARYDSLAALRASLVARGVPSDSLVRLESEMTQLLRNQTYWGKVGAYEGAGYTSTGLYRPYLDCRMFSKSLTDFCPVCQRAIERVIRFLTE
ncbi:MAG: IgA Peptidase M64 [candidate division KSB1 bacterium]|nr:IgA Peptidase M64 [candidate division KSB1 bacterium]